MQTVWSRPGSGVHGARRVAEKAIGDPMTWTTSPPFDEPGVQATFKAILLPKQMPLAYKLRKRK